VPFEIVNHISPAVLLEILAVLASSVQPGTIYTIPSWIDVTRQLGYNCFPAVVLTTGKWIKGGSPRILVDTFGRPDVFC
jgi:hypothetical protein